MAPTILQSAATALINMSFAVIVGVLASRLWLARGMSAWREPALAKLSFALAAGLATCAIGTMLSLWLGAAAMADVPRFAAAPAVWTMLAATHYGHAGVLALVLLVLAGIAHASRMKSMDSARYDRALAACVLSLALVRVTIGHAFGYGPFSVAVWFQWCHVLLTALWAGSVMVSGWIVLPCAMSGKSSPGTTTAAYLTALSRWATFALLGILATGAYHAYLVLESPRDLLGSEYGLVLSVKLCFVLAAIGLGGFNRFIGLPAVLAPGKPDADTQDGLRLVIAVLRVEAIVLLIVLTAAAVLTGSVPPTSA